MPKKAENASVRFQKAFQCTHTMGMSAHHPCIESLPTLYFGIWDLCTYYYISDVEICQCTHCLHTFC